MKNKIEIALDYIFKSSKGPKFELEALPGFEFDDGPFGDDRFSGVEELLPSMGDEPDGTSACLDLEVVLVDPDDTNLITKWIAGEVVYLYQNKLLILATPRDPKGLFTVSIYDQEKLIGWIIGKDASKLSSCLVANYDFGAAVIEVWRFQANGNMIDPRIPKNILEEPGLVANSSVIISTIQTPPTKLIWSDKQVVRKLPRGLSWDGPVYTLITVENEAAVKKAGFLEDEFFSLDNECILVPDIWTPKSKAVFAYIEDIYVGRIKDLATEERFYEELTKDGHAIGLAQEVWFEDNDENNEIIGNVRCEIRDTLRIDWDSVE